MRFLWIGVAREPNVTAQKRTSQKEKPFASLMRSLGVGSNEPLSDGFGRLRRLAGFLTGGGAILLLVLMSSAQLVLLLNPYQRAGEQVKFLLETQPGFESGLDATAIAAAALKNQLATHSAAAITRSDDPAVDQALITILTQAGIRRVDAVEFSGLAKSLGNEILLLSAALQRDTASAELANLLNAARQPGDIDSTVLSALYFRLPTALEQINDLRLHMKAIANGIRLIDENPQFQPILAELDEVITSPDPLIAPPVINYAVAFYSWRKLAVSCESLEIQFSGDALILNEMYAAVSQAQLQANRLGYKQVESIAKWVHRHIPLMGSISATLLLISAYLLFWKVQLPRSARPARQPTWQFVSRKSKPAPRRFFSQAISFVRQLWPPKAIKLPPAFRRKRIPALQIARAGGVKIVKILRGVRSYPIGGDPNNPVQISTPGQNFIEVWIRPAKVGFYIEVTFSDSPVLLNHQPINGARRLSSGDVIQILDFNLIFQG